MDSEWEDRDAGELVAMTIALFTGASSRSMFSLLLQCKLVCTFPYSYAFACLNSILSDSW